MANESKKENEKPENLPKKVEYQPLYQKITYRFCGIPFWSVTREIDSRRLYDEMSQKLLTDVENELMKIISGAKNDGNRKATRG